jgi:hypothetical protein
MTRLSFFFFHLLHPLKKFIQTIKIFGYSVEALALAGVPTRPIRNLKIYMEILKPDL